MHVHERGTSIEINCVTGTSPFNTQKKPLCMNIYFLKIKWCKIYYNIYCWQELVNLYCSTVSFYSDYKKLPYNTISLIRFLKQSLVITGKWSTENQPKKKRVLLLQSIACKGPHLKEKDINVLHLYTCIYVNLGFFFFFLFSINHQLSTLEGKLNH